MLSILNQVKFCKQISTSLTTKLFLAHYSSNVPKPKHRAQIESEPCISVPETYRSRTIVINPKTALPPDVVEKLLAPEKLETKEKVIKEEWTIIGKDTSKLYKHCLMLSKIRLTSLVVVTTMGGYVLAPGIFDLQTFLMCSVGTGLVSATANTVNQFFEVPFDAQMSRTKNRVLVRGYLTPAHAITFATISGIAGLSTLYFQVNGLTAALGGVNLILYTLFYTPLKRISIVNTWVGSIVGAIPPLMGWAGCAGDISSPGAWIMSGILYAWQFPHFNALSWNLRPDYSRAGYRMMAVTNPDLCRRTALRYTATLMALSWMAPVFDVTHWWFAVGSTPLNAYFLYLAWEFNKFSDSSSSRKLFRFSLIHLPMLMLMMFISKKHWLQRQDKKEQSSIPEKNPDPIAVLARPLITITENS